MGWTDQTEIESKPPLAKRYASSGEATRFEREYMERGEGSSLGFKIFIGIQAVGILAVLAAIFL